VWAPSKIVLDAVDGPSAKGADAVALASWFAATFDASDMLVIDDDAAIGKPADLRSLPADQAPR
jgi:dihydroneopterin aldolase